MAWMTRRLPSAIDRHDLERDSRLIRSEEDDQVFVARLPGVERARAVLNDIPRADLTDAVSDDRASEADRHIID